MVVFGSEPESADDVQQTRVGEDVLAESEEVTHVALDRPGWGPRGLDLCPPWACTGPYAGLKFATDGRERNGWTGRRISCKLADWQHVADRPWELRSPRRGATRRVGCSRLARR
jgi:hypothetical protein